MTGGNYEDLYRDKTGKTYFNSTKEKTECACRVYPKYVKPVKRYGRIHHQVNFRQFQKGEIGKLLPDYEVIKQMKEARSG
jgi:hypothetical protein